MELKVWCDGIQRVVCGVSSTTTCQDVVFALAHATGQTGRFMLIEKWRNNERLLSPQEHPVQVLSKWGEYANDVTFIMKRSDSTPQKSSQNHNQQQQQHDLKSPTSPSNGQDFGNMLFTSPNRKDNLRKASQISGTAVVSLSLVNMFFLQVRPDEFKVNILGWKDVYLAKSPDQRIHKMQGICDPYYPRDPSYNFRLTDPPEWKKRLQRLEEEKQEKIRRRRLEKQLKNETFETD